MQNRRFYFIALGLLASLLFSIALISCGEGEVIEPNSSQDLLTQQDLIGDALGNGSIIKLCLDGSEHADNPKCKVFDKQNNQVPSSTSGEEGEPCIEEEGCEPDPDLSSASGGEEEPCIEEEGCEPNPDLSSNSGGEPSSDSGTDLSSDSGVPTLLCTGLSPFGTADQPITKPTVTCDGAPAANPQFNTNPPDLSWTGPMAALYTVYAEALCGEGYILAFCGEINVSAPKASSSSTAGRSSTTVGTSSTTVPRSSSSVGGSSGSVGTCGTNSSGTMCLWDAVTGGCYKIQAEDGMTEQQRRQKCATDGWLFNGGEEGAGTLCKGGTFITGCGKDNTPPTTLVSSFGCCKWDKNGTQCYNIDSETNKGYCQGNKTDHEFWSTPCPDTNGGCPTTAPE